MNEFIFMGIMGILAVIAVFFALPALIMMSKHGAIPRFPPPPGYYYDEKWNLKKIEGYKYE